MKLFISIFLIAGNLFFISCKKERTCACEIKSTTNIIKTPTGSGKSSTEVRTTTSKVEATMSKVKKDDLTRVQDCNSRTLKSVDSYTMMMPVRTTTTMGGSTFTVTNYVPANATQTDEDVYDCEIK